MTRYRIVFGDRSVDLPAGELLVGRDEACHIRLASPSVSRRHLRILNVGGQVIAYDLGSSNGTWINDRPLAEQVELHDGDRIRVGDETFSLGSVPDEMDWLDSPKTEPRGRPLSYSAPRYRTCKHCLALVDSDDSTCPKCKRQTLPPPPVLSSPESDDRREARRLAIDAQALYVSPSLTFDGQLTDISDTGLFLATDLVDAIGTTADVLLFCMCTGGARFGGEVVRVVPPGTGSETAGMAIRFTRVEPVARKWLEQYLTDHGEPLSEDCCDSGRGGSG